MEPVQGRGVLILPDVAAFVRPVIRVLDEIADRQPDPDEAKGEIPEENRREQEERESRKEIERIDIDVQ